jgi:hypothetical protein
MWNAPTQQELAALPLLYGTEAVPSGDKVVVMHFFRAGFDWYAVEFDGRDTFMGFVAVCGDPASSEWGYFSFSELQGIRFNGLEVDRDLYWKPAPAKDIGIVANAL